MKAETAITPTQQIPGIDDEGLPLIPIAIIAGLAIVASSYLGKKK